MKIVIGIIVVLGLGWLLLSAGGDETPVVEDTTSAEVMEDGTMMEGDENASTSDTMMEGDENASTSDTMMEGDASMEVDASATDEVPVSQ